MRQETALRSDFRYVSGPVVGSRGLPMPAIVANGLVFLSGVFASDEAGEIVGVGDFGAQVRQTFANLEASLAAAGAAPNDIVKMTMYLAYPGSFRPHKDALWELLGEHQPAMAVVGVTRLSNPEALFEVDATAVLRPESA